jgi:hypothetical protein
VEQFGQADFRQFPGNLAASGPRFRGRETRRCGRFPRTGDASNLGAVVGALTARQQLDIGAGKLLLDQMTKDFIRGHLSYRFAVYSSGAEALAAERNLRAGQSPAGRPHLNPL